MARAVGRGAMATRCLGQPDPWRRVEPGCGLPGRIVQQGGRMKREFAAGFVALALALPPAAHAAEKSADNKGSVTQKAKDVIDDATITTKIKAEFAKDKAVSALSIKVDTDKGVVKLSGNAKT